MYVKQLFASMVIIPGDSAEAEAALAIESSCVVSFWASWCEPCEQMNAVFAELADEHSKTLRFVQARSHPVSD